MRLTSLLSPPLTLTMTGSYESYVRHILATACAPKDQGGLGYRAAVLNFRGCAGVPITSPRFYSAAATDDYACGALYVSTLFPKAKMIGLGKHGRTMLN